MQRFNSILKLATRRYSTGYPCVNKAMLLGGKFPPSRPDSQSFCCIPSPEIPKHALIVVSEVVDEPTVRAAGEEAHVASFTLCTHERRAKKDGSVADIRAWHKVKSFNPRQHDLVKTDLRKGTWVFAEGRIVKENWVNQEGVKQYMTVIDTSKGDLQVVAAASAEETDAVKAHA